MGRQVFLALVCWFALSRTSADAKADSIKLEDNVAEASLPRLYRSIPAGVYASAAPYAAFSFHIPTFASSPKIHHGPIKQESVIVENTHGFLKDSYGNKFVESSQSLPYRTAFPQQYVQLQELPAHLAQPLVSAAPSFQYKQVTPHFFGPAQFKLQTVQEVSPSSSNGYAINQPYGFGPVRPQQQQNPTNHKAVYAKARDAEHFQNYKNVGQSQRLEEAPNSYKSKASGTPQRDKPHINAAATSGSTNNEKNAAIKLETKPLVPLLDLTLLEPLTFANPLVPQVQHFLPRISSVTYQKLPQLNVNEIKTQMKEIMIQKTKSYESRPKVSSPQQAQHRPQLEDEDHDEQDSSRDDPEMSYEIKSPNYKETYNEKVVNYNKETQMNPVHYSYDMKSEKEPLTYNYVRKTKEPLQVKPTKAKQVNNDDNDDVQDPKHLIYKFKPEENDDEQHNDKSQQNDSGESFDENGEDEVPVNQSQQKQGDNYTKKTHSHEKPEDTEESPHRNSEKIVHREGPHHHRNPEKNIHHNSPQQHNQDRKVPTSDAPLQATVKEYEEDIRIHPTPKEYAPIKVDPNQHIQQGQVSSNHEAQEPQRQPQDSSYNQPHTHHRAYYQQPENNEDEKSKRITKEEAQEQGDPNKEQINEAPQRDDNSEENFEKAYKNAAYGFPAYESSKDTEKEIYSPEPYAPARYHTDYDIEHTPFQQYVAESDDYPKSTRSNYKDARDNTKNSYYSDYSLSKPESMLARYKQKEDYYKMFMKHKPHYLNTQHISEKNEEKKNAKYIVAPTYDYHGAAQKPKQYFAKYKAAPRPQAYEYEYAKEAPKDSSGAQATLPFQRLKTYTQFVEPQFQYGFEPSALPQLLDSELAAMASNNSPESEKPGTRKKVYKENWYIKKTSTNGRKAGS